MDAVIFSQRDCPSAIAWDVAGAPLLLRQLEWLKGVGCDRVVLELVADAPVWESVDRVLGEHAAAASVECVLTERPLGPVELGRRAGLGERPFLAIAANEIAQGDPSPLFARGPGARGVFASTGLRGLGRATVQLLDRNVAEASAELSLDGWGAALGGPAEAHALGLLALSGSLTGVLIHAAEIAPGVWSARGAMVEQGAVVQGPSFLGSDALVCAGAAIGPGAVLGARTVLSAGTRVRDATVDADTVVGEGLAFERCSVTVDGVHDWESGATARMDDALLLEARGGSGAWISRGLALAALAVLAPVAWGTARTRRAFGELAEVARGERRWLGAGRPVIVTEGLSEGLVRAAKAAPRGLLAVERALPEQCLHEEDRLRTLAWYATAKGIGVDASLLWSWLRHAARADVSATHT